MRYLFDAIYFLSRQQILSSLCMLAFTSPAFLCSWLLDDPSKSTTSRPSSFAGDSLCADNNQADKCLLCVVKICMALHHDNYYIETMSDLARERLLTKLSKRTGPVVQMGFGLHAGKAVQGAIGSERKIDGKYNA